MIIPTAVPILTTSLIRLNGSGQEPRNHHFDWNLRVNCQNPPKLREPTCVIWKDVPVLFFFPKSRKKRLDKQAWSSLSIPPPPPNCSFPPEKCWIWIHEIWETPRYTAKNSGVGGKRELWACLSRLSFLLLGKSNTGTYFHITKVGLRNLGGFWHTWKFQSKCRLRGSCPEPFIFSFKGWENVHPHRLSSSSSKTWSFLCATCHPKKKISLILPGAVLYLQHVQGLWVLVPDPGGTPSFLVQTEQPSSVLQPAWDKADRYQWFLLWELSATEGLLPQNVHSQEWSISNYPYHLTRSITSHSMKNLAFHSLLRWKVIIYFILQILTTPHLHIPFKGWENELFLNVGMEGLKSSYNLKLSCPASSRLRIL